MVGRSLNSSRRTWLPLGILVAAACVPDGPGRPAGSVVQGLPEVLAGAPCSDSVRSTLEGWGAGPEYLDGAPASTGVATLRFPTRERGVWVVVQSEEGHPPTLQRVDAEGVTLRSFGAECVPHDVAAARSVSRRAGVDDFDDRALNLVLSDTGTAPDHGVVVYAWSPHMPLSVDGWAEVDDAARTVGLTAVPVLIAEADEGFARREADRVGIPPEGLRAITSVELIMRDLQLHAPAILVFTDDRVSPVLPGYRNSDGYRRFFEAFLEPAE